MFDRHFYVGVTRSAQRSQVIQFVRNIYNQIIAPCMDVVNVQRPPAAATFCGTEAAALIPFNNGHPDALPASPMLKPSSACVVGMPTSYHRVFGTFVRAESATARRLGCKCSIFCTACFVRKRDGRNQTRVATFPRTMADFRPRRVEDGLALHAGCSARSIPLRIKMARGRAKPFSGLFLYQVAGALKTIATMSALKCRPVLHRRRMAIAPAKDRRPMVAAEIIVTLGADLEHR